VQVDGFVRDLYRESERGDCTPPRLVILDLDRTITTSDTLVPFLLGCFFRYPRMSFRLCLLPVDALLFLAGRLSATRFKERMLTAFVANLSVATLWSWAREFARRVTESGCNPEVLSFIKQCQERGDRLIIVSASPDIYVPLLAANLSITETVTTRTEVTSGRYTGRLVGENCKGAEKVRRLTEYLKAEPDDFFTVALGDDDSDLPLLSWANLGIRVRKGRLVPLNAAGPHRASE